MARLEIPGLYRLDIGSSDWGWHKMEDLRTAVGLLFERSCNGLPEALRVDASADGRPTAKALLQEYGHLNRESVFSWTDEVNIDCVPAKDVPCHIFNLFVPARWSLDVIDSVKNTINPSKLHGVDLFNLTQDCLTERERVVMELRLGIAEGKALSHQEIARWFETTHRRIRQIEDIAQIKMRREEQNLARTVK